MNRHILLAIALCVPLMSSCSWAKRRLHMSSESKAQQVVQPSRAQQEEALRMLAESEDAQPVAEEAEPPALRSELPMRAEDAPEALPPAEPDIAQQRGLRSPALPKLLPMDIYGKLNTSSSL